MSRRRGLAVILAVALLLAGCGRQQAVVGDPDPVAVRLETAFTGTISEALSISGDVTAGSEVQVVPRIAGRVARVPVKMGQEVKKGDLLVELEAQELAIGVRQAEAALEMARANYRNASSGGMLSQLKAGKQQAEAHYNNARATLERMESLYTQGGISLQQLEGTRLQHQVAESQYNLAKEQLELFERGEGQVQVLAAQVRQAEAGLEMARLNYNNALITAPADGVVAVVSAEPGNMASPGMPVAVVVSVAEVIVSARLTEQTVGHVSPGMPVRVEIASLGREFSGEVREVAPSPLTGAKSYPVKIRVFDADGVIPGMFVRVIIDVATSNNAVLVPRRAVLETDGTYYLFTVSDNRAVKRVVTVGLRNDLSAEILDGITAGEKVVSTGHHYLREGTPVLVEEGATQ